MDNISKDIPVVEYNNDFYVISEEDGKRCLMNEHGTVYLSEEEIDKLCEEQVEEYAPYRDKKTDDIVMTGEIDEGKVVYWDTDNMEHTMSVKEFLGKYKKGTAKDLDVFNDED